MVNKNGDSGLDWYVIEEEVQRRAFIRKNEDKNIGLDNEESLNVAYEVIELAKDRFVN